MEPNIAEKKFKEWLDYKKYPYMFIEQNKETFATFFRGVTKRPDFFILLENLGIICVDVKEKELSKYETFVIDYEEIEKYIQFERLFRIPVWFAISNQAVGYKTWYWIPLSKIVEIGVRRIRRADEREFFAIKIIDFVTIAYDDSLSRLFNI